MSYLWIYRVVGWVRLTSPPLAMQTYNHKLFDEIYMFLPCVGEGGREYKMVKMLPSEKLCILYHIKTFVTCISHIRKPVALLGSNSIGSSSAIPIFGRMYAECHVFFYKAPPTPATCFHRVAGICGAAVRQLRKHKQIGLFPWGKGGGRQMGL